MFFFHYSTVVQIVIHPVLRVMDPQNHNASSVAATNFHMKASAWMPAQMDSMVTRNVRNVYHVQKDVAPVALTRASPAKLIGRKTKRESVSPKEAIIVMNVSTLVLLLPDSDRINENFCSSQAQLWPLCEWITAKQTIEPTRTIFMKLKKFIFYGFVLEK